jgi:hypothetical protein
MQFEFPTGSPGIHPPTAALTRILTLRGALNPADQQPYSEAMLLGIGGGLDTGYILYQFKHLPYPILVLGFRNQWNQSRLFLQTVADRLNLHVRFQQFSGQITAEKALQKTIKTGKPAIVWVDKASLPYRQIPESLKGFYKHQVTVYGRDGRLWHLFIDDLSSGFIEIREKTLTAARANLPQNNFLMMVIEKVGNLSKRDLQKAIIEGIRDCAIQLTRAIQTLGISNLYNWAGKLTDRQHPMGWPQVFKDQKGLIACLCTLYESIKCNGTEGFALRKLYAEYLHHASDILSNGSLNAVAGQYLQLSNHWSNLAENALPSKVSKFDRVKKLLNKKNEAYRANNNEVYGQTINDLNTLTSQIEEAFPLNSIETGQLFERLSSQIKLIAELEISAARRLQDIAR